MATRKTKAAKEKTKPKGQLPQPGDPGSPPMPMYPDPYEDPGNPVMKKVKDEVAGKNTPKAGLPASDAAWLDEITKDAEAEEQQEQQQEAAPVSNQDLLAYTEELLQIEQQKAQLTAELKQVDDRRKQLRTQLIPDTMKQLGMINSKGKGSFTYGGHRVHLEQKLFASCSEEGKLKLFPFLKENGAEDLIKETVNAQTLSAYIRERRADGFNDPPGVSVFEEVTAKVTKVK